MKTSHLLKAGNLVASCFLMLSRAVASTYDQIPEGWRFNGQNAQLRIDRETFHHGYASALLLKMTSNETNRTGRIWRSVRADAYRGKRVRFSGFVKTRNVKTGAGLVMEVDSGRSYDYMDHRRIRGTTNWQKHELVLDVPATAFGIDFGASLFGAGEMWIDDLKLEIVDSSVAVTGAPSNEDWLKGTEADKWIRQWYEQNSTHPQNLDFEGSATRRSTYTYKKVADLEIQADVFRPDDDVIRPVLVEIHGGALINGRRGTAGDKTYKRIMEAGYVSVSIDYRLAPETKLPGIIEDLEDAFNWVRTKGPDLFKADPSNIAAWGSSAGGYLALTAGYRVTPRPKAIVSFFGFGDLIGEWQTRPSNPTFDGKPGPTEKEARALIGTVPVSNGWQRKRRAGGFFVFCREHGILPNEQTGWDPKTEAEKFYPFMPLKNVSRDFPPTILVHGTDDKDVPHEQSALMAEQFRMHGVTHGLITVPNAGHGLVGGDQKLIDEATDEVFAFLKRHVK